MSTDPTSTVNSRRFSADFFIKIWYVLAYLMLAIALVFCLVDPKVRPVLKIVAVGQSAGWGVWYWWFVLQRRRRGWSNGVVGVSFVFAIAASIALSWIHPAFLMMAFGFYGITFAVLPLMWAIPLIVMLSLALAWRISGFSGAPSLSNLPILFSFLASGFFTIILGLYIDSIIRQSRERQRMIEELEATRGELALAERQAGMLEERQRLAGEIHDTLAQGFTSVVMHLEAAEQALQNDPEAVRKHIDQARQTAREQLGEARRFLWTLRPDVVAREPLAQALRRVAQQWSAASSLPAHLEVAGLERALTAPIEATLLRAAQEALANVRKHAQASQVNLTLTYMEDEVILDVQDDGVGFDPAQVPAQAGPDHGYGLVALRERASQLSGSLEVESASGEGTTIVIALPIAGREPVVPAKVE